MEFLEMTSKRRPTMVHAQWAALLSVLLSVSACAPPREVLTVTMRPETIPSSEGDMPAPVDETAARYPETRPERFDDGRMWTFEAPPVDWFEEAYGFRPDVSWLERARLGALRFGDICSASLVSHRGLVMTNHHCARDFVARMSREGERLLDDGYLAMDEDQERRVSGLSVRQLIEIEDVSQEVNRAARDVPGWGPQAEAREKRIEAIERRMKARLSPSDSTREFKVVELVPGVRYSLYTYRVYHDVRLVWVPELAIGMFGGETDNFEWPRHTLDAAFFRIWEKGEPLRTANHFMFDPSGAEEDEPVFVVGNPGSTERLVTVSQLEYQRDVQLPEDLYVLRNRIALLGRFVSENRAKADSFDVRNNLMGANNQLKALEGQLAALEVGWVLSRTQAWEDSIRFALGRSDSLSGRYGRPFRDIQLIQQSKELSAPRARAFTQFLNPSISSHILMRAMYGYVYALSARRGAPPETLKEIMDEAMTIADWPRELEQQVISARLQDFQRALGENNPTVRRLLGDMTPQAMADSVALLLFSGD
ncbi:MAG: S46 family peptidase [Bacteroidetes bacterium]|nr:S46 family peptidase [Bacteroidota bacterium]